MLDVTVPPLFASPADLLPHFIHHSLQIYDQLAQPYPRGRGLQFVLLSLTGVW